MRLGVTLPQFREDADVPLAVARRAEAAGLDGVFVFDHLWPLHRPERPALHSLALLGALTAETSSVVLASFVARVSLLPDAVLVHALHSLHRMAGDRRFIAGLGTGDANNRDENAAYGVGFAPADDRGRQVADCCRRLRVLGVPTWVGGESDRARSIASEEADGWNAWGVSVQRFAVLAAGLACQTSWGGQVLLGRTPSDADAKLARYGTRPGLVHGTPDALRHHLSTLEAAGARWAVCSPLDVGDDEQAVDLVAEARP
ncbi:MAG: LLM class flavin-dependent oxidoreductase [Acidimicrobiia bacterium]|nr:LLM class flavin-dependent oxidoreductase [Acidimicrobiia bacterium]